MLFYVLIFPLLAYAQSRKGDLSGFPTSSANSTS
ncbi:predicted protein [Sclerotinia sclerotiorum 1980 UF-70]|uniref:Uncharacterized protein n=1 Tax=Sclerotinia sclerotiorum (strain ATCC 18683 / 1980 / Ss-1) TaxID=665079 RepID=A7ES55_SCLS1|nr:predicted protein [Sclerotinia sclerotiorum 1980 UF-70]EDN92297.1 predicted protein [Sclerotinia sclerotiorum 1980 UF-70]